MLVIGPLGMLPAMLQSTSLHRRLFVVLLFCATSLVLSFFVSSAALIVGPLVLLLYAAAPLSSLSTRRIFGVIRTPRITQAR